LLGSRQAADSFASPLLGRMIVSGPQVDARSFPWTPELPGTKDAWLIDCSAMVEPARVAALKELG